MTRRQFLVLAGSTAASTAVPGCGDRAPTPTRAPHFFTAEENHPYKLHDIDNLYAADGCLFATSSGYNPTLTIEALATYVAGNIVAPGHPERVLGRQPD